MNPKVNFYFEKTKKWKAEYELLREIALESGLEEELKWGCPCYTLEKSNVFLIHGFKEYCALLFMKGALMSDKAGLLIQQTENVQAARQIRFTNLAEIVKHKTTIKSYITDAIRIEKSGAKVELKKTTEFKMVAEFEKALNDWKELKAAFYKLTPGRQHGYLLYFSSAKQPQTREARIEKCAPKIIEGKGLED